MRNTVCYDISKPMYIIYINRDEIYCDNILLAWSIYQSMVDKYVGTVQVDLIDGQTGEVFASNDPNF